MPFDDTQIDAVAQAHPLQTRALYRTVHQGATVADIVAGFGLPVRYGLPQVHLVRGGQLAPVPMDMWGKVRPKAGTRVEVSYPVEGPLVAMAAAAAVSAAAPWVAGTLFGLTAGTLAYTAAVAAVTVIGGLVINALIPPVQQPRQDQQNYVVTGIQNMENRYGIYPKVLGRHRIYPPKTARGYTETVGQDIYYRGRMTFGWGPLALEDLRIGTTPIHQFEGVEVEFLNVDQAQTLARYPELAGITRAWRSGTEPLLLCPDDVSEDAYNVRLMHAAPVTRFTRSRSESASIDIAFPQGQISHTARKGEARSETVSHGFRYRPAGGTWVDAGIDIRTAKTSSYIRYTKTINFPEPGEYEIEVTRISGDSPEDRIRHDSYLSAIRSHRSGNLPSYDGIAEVAFRIKASEQLSGQVDSLNAIVQQLAPVWTGTIWTAPQPVRHPAWVFLDAIRGPHLRRPVTDERIDLDAFRAWATEEPHWTCDYVIDTETRTADVLDVIAAAGRARRALTDLQYSIIRDGAAGPVRQMFSPRNSWGFKGSIAFPRPVHALRCLVRSERLEWEQDEVTVYADGHDHSTATEFETLEIPGVVVTAADEDEGNAWRLGRYHLAQAILRPETYEWHADWEHMRVTRGDKVQLVHDVPMIGVGAARIREISATVILDEIYDMPPTVCRLTVRAEDGSRHSFIARSPDDPLTRVWTPVGAVPPEVQPGDLVFVEEVAQESMEVLITGIYPDGDSARITAVPAAPAVLLADQGDIPPYTPVITPGRHAAVRGPLPPEVKRLISDETTMLLTSDGTVQARLGVVLEPVATADDLGSVQMRWRVAGGDDPWVIGSARPAGDGLLLSDPVQRGDSFEVEVRSVSSTGRTRGWIAAGTVTAQGTEAPPPDVTGFAVVPIEQQAQLRWDPVEGIPDLAWAEIRYAAVEGASWNASTLLDRIAYPGTSARMFARPGTYLIKWVDWEGRYSPNAAAVYLSENRIKALNAVEVLEVAPDWLGVFSGTDVTAEGALVLDRVGDEYPAEGVWTSAEVVDLGASYPVQVTPFIEARGFFLHDAMSEWPSLRALPALVASSPDTWLVEVDVSTSEDNITWSPWQEVSGGEFAGRYYVFRVRLYSSRTDVTPRVDDLVFVLDMPDRVDGVEDVQCPAGGMRVTYDPAFRNVPSVVVTPRDAPSGSRVVIGGKTRAGFDIAFFDSSNVSISQRFDWVARGYGREAV